jgi:glyoxylase-like metal-dependent hydrolase (beta-lactamase superfamily II)
MIDNLAAATRAFTSNVFYVGGERPVVVDPGANFDVLERLAERPAPEAVVLTHTHPDHVGNVSDVVEAYGVDVWGFEGDHDLVDHELEDGDVVTMGDHEYRAVFTPGHHPGHLCFYAADPGILFAGDLVFANGGFGRTDLDGADHATLVESIERLLAETDEVSELHTGHGPSVTQEARDHVELALQAARASA